MAKTNKVHYRKGREGDRKCRGKMTIENSLEEVKVEVLREALTPESMFYNMAVLGKKSV